MIDMACAYIGLGSNLGEPAEQLRQAFEALSLVDGIEDIQSSPWYQSPAVGPGEQPDYVNAVAKIRTPLPPAMLLAAMQAIENQQGRVRNIRWGARTLDLDVLLYDDLIMHTDVLTIPHPEIANRSFVLKPLHDLAPDLYLPNVAPVAELLAACGSRDLVAIESLY